MPNVFSPLTCELFARRWRFEEMADAERWSAIVPLARIVYGKTQKHIAPSGQHASRMYGRCVALLRAGVPLVGVRLRRADLARFFEHVFQFFSHLARQMACLCSSRI